MPSIVPLIGIIQNISKMVGSASHFCFNMFLIYFFKNRGALQEMFHWKSEHDDESGEI